MWINKVRGEIWGGGLFGTDATLHLRKSQQNASLRAKG